MIVTTVPFEELEHAPNLHDMLDEYSIESRLSGMPPPIPHMDSYHLLVKADLLTTLCAYEEDTIIGFLLLLVNMMPHYSTPVATVESFFVPQAHRSTGAGLKLLIAAQKIAQEKGAAGILVAAAVNSDFDRLMSSMYSYTKSHNAYFRSFK